MANITSEERILRHIRSIFAGRDVSMEEAARHCNVSVQAFEKEYEQYIGNMCLAIRQGREWAVLQEYRTLIQDGYMRAGEFVKRFKMKLHDASNFLDTIATEKTHTISELVWFVRMNEYISLVNAGYLTDEQCLDIINVAKDDFERWVNAWKITKQRMEEAEANERNDGQGPE